MRKDWHPFKDSMNNISGKTKEFKSYTISFNQYKNIVERYAANPLTARLPENVIDEWIKIICNNTALIYCSTIEYRINGDKTINMLYVSDFGTNIILRILNELTPKSTPEEKLLLIDRVLNVVHPRGPLAFLFIE